LNFTMSDLALAVLAVVAVVALLWGWNLTA
jgi:hypothetical protein